VAGPIITLTTDFGTRDGYVAAMKGIMLSINADATIVDVSHDVGAQQVLEAVFLTESAWPYFPPSAIHIGIVDPGVGSERSSIALETPRGRFVGPDNGVLSSALANEDRPRGEADPTTTRLPDGCRAVSLTNKRYQRIPVSATFHGRDLFAPAAAYLSLGVPLDELGEPVEQVLAFPPLRAQRGEGGLLARVLHVDRFGNVVLDAREEDLPASFTVEIGGRAVAGPVKTYASATSLAAIVGSAGYLEIALPNGDAAQALGVDVGAPALVR
jgi:S-adenosylmethionine hydrolase